MEALNQKINEIDTRLRIVEQSNMGLSTTLSHFTATLDTFIVTLENHEKKENIRFEKFETTISSLQKFAYVGIGGLILLQFLIANKIIMFGV